MNSPQADLAQRLDEGDEAAYAHQPELAVVALLTMMSAFPARQSPAIAESVIAHLYRVSADARYAPALRDAAAQLVGSWVGYRRLAGVPAGHTPPQ